MLLKKMKFVLGFLSAVLLAACSDGDDFDELTKPQKVYVTGNWSVHPDFPEELVISSVQVVMLDSLYNPLCTLDTKAHDTGHSSRAQDYYELENVSFISPYVRVLIHALGARDSTKMEFAFLDNIDDGISFNLVYRQTFLEYRVDTLMARGLDLDEAKQQAAKEFDDLYYEFRYNRSKMHLILRHFISDSVFYSDIQEMREVLASDSASLRKMSIRAADDIMGNYNGLEWTNGYKGKLNNPDSFMKDVLGLKSCGKEGTLDSIKEPLSTHYGDALVCDGESGSYGVSLAWRVMWDLDKAFGACTYAKQDTALTDSVVYLCRKNESGWRVETDSILSQSARVGQAVGICGVNIFRGDVRFYKDTLYICKYDSTRGYYWATEKEPSGWVSSACEAVEKEYCDRGAKKQLAGCSGGFICKDSLWTWVDLVRYSAGECDMTNEGEKALVPTDSTNLYLVCSDKAYGGYDYNVTADNHGWKKIEPWEYYGDPCDYKENYMALVKYDSVYYKCNGYQYVQLTDDALVPPTFDKRVCNNGNKNEIVKYDSTYYICSGYNWFKASAEDITPPVLQDNYCTSSKSDEIAVVNGEYFTCNGLNYKWEKSSDKEIELYNMPIDNGIDCSKGMKGTKIIWSDKLNGLYGCFATYGSEKIEFGSYYVTDGNVTKDLANGIFIDSVTYEVKKGDLTYRFYASPKFLNSNTLNFNGAYKGSAEQPEAKYDFWMKDGAFILHAERGDGVINMSQIAESEKSENFESFYKWWLEFVSKDHKHGSYSVTATVDSVVLLWYNDKSLVDYEMAASTCPSGFHLPDTSEWSLVRDLPMSIEQKSTTFESPFEVHFSGTYELSTSPLIYSRGYAIYWTQTPYDESKQYCLFKGWDDNARSYRIGVGEVSKTLKPMVQAICIEDKDLGL